jgi:4-amino-4-deoxy-L-arabinose transferase-like glycosyltransferase
VKQALLIVALVLALRLPFLNQAIQGDDVYYLYGAEHAQIEPFHPTHASYVFQGDKVDMRGHPHPPLNVWVLAAILAMVGDVREVPFHLAYMAFSIIAALAMWSLARRFVPDRAMLAVLLFLAVPAFVINGGSLEADLPFLAFWMAAIALFVRAVDEESAVLLACAAGAGALAGLAAYQAILLTPILAVYLFEKRRAWTLGWIVALAAPGALALWQVFERLSGGALPASMLAGYLQTYGLEAVTKKVHSAAALVVHLGWMISPVGVVAAFGLRSKSTGSKWTPWLAALAAGAGAFYDANPLMWITLGCGVLVLAYVLTGTLRQHDFLCVWMVIFFAGAVVLFFAGSARYLLPVAAPLAILVARVPGIRILLAAVVLQMPLSVALAAANYQHWDGYRVFAASLKKPATGHHVWVTGEWGLRYYLESDGALPLERDQMLEPGDMVVSSDLAGGANVTAPTARVAEFDIVPAVPLRLIALDGRSAYSSSARGLLPFEISRAAIDHVHADVVIERKAELSYLDARDARGAAQIISGLYPDAWMGAQASVLLKPAPGRPLRVEIYIPPAAPARRLRMIANGRVLAEETFPGPGNYALVVPYGSDSQSPGSDQSGAAAGFTLTLTVDNTYSVPPDQRQLGVVVTGVGFR